MSKNNESGRLKVCCTCAHWSYKYKGFCHRLGQGVGKFWMCEDWSPVAADAEGVPSGGSLSAKALSLET